MISPIRRRAALRRAHRAPCQAVAVDRFRAVGHRLVDLSHRGARLVLADDVSPGELLVLSFAAPRSGDVIDAVAEVRCVEDGEAGLTFTELPWEARAALFVELAGVPPPVPSRARPVDYARAVRRIALPAA